MSKSQDFIRFCGQLVFAPEENAWDSLPPERQREYCLLAQKNGWDLLFVRMLSERLPEPFYREFRLHYQKESLIRMVESRDLFEFYRLLESEKIPFVPIKGTDMKFRIYFDPVLRSYEDWDILFRKEDCPRLIRLLLQQNWRTYSGFAPKFRAGRHHYPPMLKKQHSLEIHWTLPSFLKVDPKEIWKETLPINEYHRVLTPEMNLLLISAHASNQLYMNLSPRRILLDAGMILKNASVDWDKIHHLADQWGILRPDLLLHAWNDFFPNGVLPEEKETKQQVLIREIIAMNRITQKHSRYEQMVAAGGFRRLIRCLDFYRPSSICCKYRLQSGQYWKILQCGVADLWGKTFFYLTHFRSKNLELQRFFQKIAEEKNCRKINRERRR